MRSPYEHASPANSINYEFSVYRLDWELEGASTRYCVGLSRYPFGGRGDCEFLGMMIGNWVGLDLEPGLGIRGYIDSLVPGPVRAELEGLGMPPRRLGCWAQSWAQDRHLS